MSIILKGINLPKDNKPLNLEIYSDGHIWINWGPEYERKNNVAIQIDRPHGRLTDVDKLKEAIRTDIMGGLNYEHFMNNAPTILEAEGEE